MSGATPQLPLQLFMACIGATSLDLTFCIIIIIIECTKGMQTISVEFVC